LSGRAGEVTLAESYALFVQANLSFTDGMSFRRSDTEACEYGHTDHKHTARVLQAGSAVFETDVSRIGVCRKNLVSDLCEDNPPPFVCVCVAKKVRDVAQDPISDDERFNLWLVSFGSIGVAAFMLVMRCIAYGRYLVQRHCCRESDALRRVHQQDDDDAATRSRTRYFTRRRREDKASLISSRPVHSVEDEIRELWGCAISCTLCVCLVGGPIVLVYAWPRPFPYWVGCGFRLPYVDPNDALSGRLTTVLNGRL